jgi:prepilin-type N-terminal cleavage/methylation domain-containing protein
MVVMIDRARVVSVRGIAGRASHRERGLTFIEMIAAVFILLLVSTVALPLGVNTVKRGKELALQPAKADKVTQMRKGRLPPCQ